MMATRRIRSMGTLCMVSLFMSLVSAMPALAVSEHGWPEPPPGGDPSPIDRITELLIDILIQAGGFLSSLAGAF